MLGDVPVWRHRGCSRHTPAPFAVRVASAVALTSSPPDMPKGPCGVIWVAVGSPSVLPSRPSAGLRTAIGPAYSEEASRQRKVSSTCDMLNTKSTRPSRTI